MIGPATCEEVGMREFEFGELDQGFAHPGTPLLRRGGVDARSNKNREATFERADGVVLTKYFLTSTTPSAPARRLRDFSSLSRPPLLD